MAISAANVITRAQDIIQDQTGVRWPEAELMRYLNDARREVCIARPDLYSTTSAISLVAGTKQSLPADGTRFLDATRNVNADNSPGRAVRVVEREILDAQLPNWHVETAAATKHFMFDERSPRVFYVYPPAAAAQKLEVVYSRTPTDITNTAIELTEEDIYTGALVDYVCYRAFSKDSEYAGNLERAGLHYSQFRSILSGGNQINTYVSPNTANVGGRIPKNAAAAAATGG